MYILAALSVAAAVAVRAESDDTAASLRIAPEITTIKANKSYAVKLECLGCAFAVRDADSQLSWQEPPQENALRLEFMIGNINGPEPRLLLNRREVLPLEINALAISAMQVPASITVDDMEHLGYGPPTDGFQMPLQYEHTVLRTHEGGHTMLQFDVTGLAIGSMRFEPSLPSGPEVQPVKLDKSGQKLVQVMLQQDRNTQEYFIEDIQVVARENRAQPFRMKCGKLAMVRTTYDPREWDNYGKLGTWSRTWSYALEQASNFWFVKMHNAVLLPLALLIVVGAVMLRRWNQRQQEKDDLEDDAESALLGSGYGDEPPAYADIPVIKVDECD